MNTSSKSAWGARLVGQALLVLLGVALGSMLAQTPSADAEVRRRPVPESFKSGGQLSVPVLREIAGTLAQMDARVSRIEKSLAEIAVQAKKAR